MPRGPGSSKDRHRLQFENTRSDLGNPGQGESPPPHLKDTALNPVKAEVEIIARTCNIARPGCRHTARHRVLFISVTLPEVKTIGLIARFGDLS